MKRLLSVLLILILVLTFFAGCNGEPTEEEPVGEVTEEPGEEVTEPEAPMEKTKVKFAVQPDSTDGLNALIEAFNAQSDMYEVEPVILTNDTGAMHDLIINSLSAKSGEYDVLSMDVVWAGEFAAAGYLEPLDTFIGDSGWSAMDFNAGSMDSGKFKGKHYALPYFPDLGFLYYRSDIVSEEDAAMLTNGDYTWDDLYAMAEKYMGEGGTMYGHVFQSKQYEGLTCNINEFSANWTDLEGGLETMKMFTDSDVTPKDILVYTEGETHNAFLNGESVFARNWPYMNGMAASGDYAVTTDKVGYAPLPGGGTVGGWILGVNSNSQNQEGALAFIGFVSGPEGQKINSISGGYLPGFNALLEDPDVLASNALLTDEGFQNALGTTIARPVAANYSEVSDIIQVRTHEFLSGNGTLEDSVAGMKAALEQ